jgi:hypothetical protein
MQILAPYPTALDPVVPVIVHCAPLTGWAEYIPGTVDNTTVFEDITPVDGFYDFSGMSPEGHQYIEPDFKLSLSWDKVNSGDSTNTSTSQDGSNYDKGITSDFTFFDAAYRFIYNWLLSTECQILNAVEVKIIDLIAKGNNADPAGNYRIFEIKSDNLEYAPVDEPCQFHVKLREQDTIWHCIHKTTIWDDWQGWFKSGGFNHPTFLTCIEPRPRLINSARMALLLFYHSNPSIALIDFLIPGNIRDDARKILNANRFVDAPLIQTYVNNVAGKCGMTTDTIFDFGQPFADVCLYFPQSGFMYENDDDTISPSQAFTYDNRWLITIAELFDKLKIVFAAEWYVTPNNQIVFKHIKDLLNLAPIYDFTAIGAEPIYDLKYSFNGTKKPAYGRYEYTDDGSDLASQEMDTLYNDIVDYDGPANNPMLEGERVKNFEFAPTGFIRDGRAKDYLKLLINDGKIGALILVAIIFVLIGVLAAGVLTAGAAIALGIVFALWLTGIFLNTTSLTQEFVDNPIYSGAVRLTSEQTLQPRLLLWDGISLQTAKTEARVGMPVPNPYYNPALTPYNEKNQIQQDNPSAIVYNYPLYFDGDYYDNLFPLYHDPIDNPLKSLETHQDVSFSVDLCVDMLNLFGVFQNQYAQIGKIVKLEHRDNYDVFVRIGNINVDYDGSKINIRGIVIRRKQDQVDTLNPGNIPVVTPEESAGPPPPDEPCMKWINRGDTDATVTYRDCNNNLVSAAVIPPGGIFCSIQIIEVGGGDIETGTVCEESASQSGSGSGSGSGESGSAATDCIQYINIAIQAATGVSYIDCDGNLITGVDIPFMGTFCAQQVVNSGSCGALVNVGICNPCEPCCAPTIDSVTLGACTPIGTIEFLLPDATINIPYEYIQSLEIDGATPPFVVNVTSKPDWMTIAVDPITNNIVFSGTPDEVSELTEINFTISNCNLVGFLEVGTFIITNNNINAGPDQVLVLPATTVNLDGSTTCTGGTYLWTTAGDGTFDDDTILNPVYTPGAGDISAGIVSLTLTMSGSSCGGGSDTMDIVIVNVEIDFIIDTLVNSESIAPSFQVLSSITAAIDWDDGSPIQSLGTLAAGNYNPSHVYATAGTYHPVYYFSDEQITSFAGNTWSSNVRLQLWSTNIALNFSTLVLTQVMDIDNVFPNLAASTQTMNLIGRSDSVTTIGYFFYASANLHTVDMESFPLMTSVQLIPANVYNLSFANNPVLNDFDSGGAPVIHILGWSPSNGTGVTYGTLDLTACNNFSFNADLSVTEVNNFLVALDANGLSGGVCDVRQIPTAAPTGAGATAKANLIGKGWTVTTD